MDTILDGERTIQHCTSRVTEIVQNSLMPQRGVYGRFFTSLFVIQAQVNSSTVWGIRLQRYMQRPQRLWPVYYLQSKNKIYKEYRNDWYNTNNYQFDSHRSEDDEVFAYNPDKQIFVHEHIPSDTVSSHWHCTYNQRMASVPTPTNALISAITCTNHQSLICQNCKIII